MSVPESSPGLLSVLFILVLVAILACQITKLVHKVVAKLIGNNLSLLKTQLSLAFSQISTVLETRFGLNYECCNMVLTAVFWYSLVAILPSQTISGGDEGLLMWDLGDDCNENTVSKDEKIVLQIFPEDKLDVAKPVPEEIRTDFLNFGQYSKLS